MTTVTGSRPSNGYRLRARLRPLHVAVFLQGFALWVPVEKLFMSEIGFTAASVGLMAAAYAAVVPLLEVPSGVLADRWSRRGVLVVSGAALTVSPLLGGLSHDVPTYVLSALVLGVFFAMNSGTLDSIVYDTVLEETGDSAAFERQLGRARLLNSAAMVLSSLLGGALAALLGTRATYLLTVPVAVLSIVALLRFTEPTLHRPAEPTPLREHLVLTCRALIGGGRLLPTITLAVLTGLVLQVILEFGPLWLVALAAPAVLYGPYWAGVVSALGLGGLVAGRFPLGRVAFAAPAAVLMGLAGVALSVGGNLVIVTVAQVLLALLVVAAGIHASRLLHDAVPSTVRAGVASGVSTLTWLVFLPIALGIGLLSEHRGVHASGWLITVLAAAAGGLLVASALRGRGAQASDAAS
jgi:predicted MFS family arabinose efflux permease